MALYVGQISRCCTEGPRLLPLTAARRPFLKAHRISHLKITGTGKTTSARVLSTQAAVPLIYIPLESLMSKW